MSLLDAFVFFCEEGGRGGSSDYTKGSSSLTFLITAYPVQYDLRCHSSVLTHPSL